MRAQAIPVPVDGDSILPGYQFADAYAVMVPPEMDAIAATRRIIGGTPVWVNALMHLRNALVGLFGLKTAPISQFPVIAESPRQVMLGFDDSHLDFRILVLRHDKTPQISVTTIVRTHNTFGRLYLRLVMPFHRVIARRMTERLLA